jgi:RNA polymerase sigma factor (sigma-70 family)
MNELRVIIERSQGRDMEAYGEVVRRFRDMAVGYAYAVLGDFHLAEDAAQEAFVEAYRKLGQLRDAAAFPGWFRRVVFKQCDRIRRRKRAKRTPLGSAKDVTADVAGPAEEAERREMQQAVLEAIRGLPDEERATTTLFYIDGYSQEQVADFLEVPVTTVDNRLRSSRKRLKERMMGMVEQTLKQNAPDERFSRKVINGLLARPRPLEIDGHPVRQVWEIIRGALPRYEVIEGEEVEEKGLVDERVENMHSAYFLDDTRTLRTQMTTVTMRAMRGRAAPVRLVAAGRCFRPDQEDARHLKVFHQVDVLCIERGADVEGFEATARRVLEAVLGPLELRWTDHNYDFLDYGRHAQVAHKGAWLSICAGGMIASDVSREAGHDPDEVGGFAFGLGLERLAKLKFGIEDIRALWRPPYVPE